VAASYAAMTSAVADRPRLDVPTVFAALGEPTRLDIVARLSLGDATVGELAAPYAMTTQAVSKHVRVLERAGLVTKTRHGQRRTVHLEAGVFGLVTDWLERRRLQAEQRYQRLDRVLDAMRAAETPETDGGGPS
jgi:DNA-binding transcriptional ArsR family regulator